MGTDREPEGAGDRTGRKPQGQSCRVRYLVGSVQQRVYWARSVVTGLERFSRRGERFLDRGGEWQEWHAQLPPGWRFVVWFDAGDRERKGDRMEQRSWPQHRACYECEADPAVNTRVAGTGKRQRGFVEGAFRVLRSEVGERASRMLGALKARGRRPVEPVGRGGPR